MLHGPSRSVHRVSSGRSAARVPIRPKSRSLRTSTASLRLGMPGTATVYADTAGLIGLLMSILVWISSYTAYL